MIDLALKLLAQKEVYVRPSNQKRITAARAQADRNRSAQRALRMAVLRQFAEGPGIKASGICLPFASSQRSMGVGKGLKGPDAPRRLQRAPSSPHKGLEDEGTQNRGEMDQRLALAPQKARVARRRAGSGQVLHRSPPRRSGHRHQRQRARPPRHSAPSNDAGPHPPPPLPRIIPGRRAGAAPPRPGASGSAGPSPGPGLRTPASELR
jgi:hypothetical protein